MAPQPKRRHSGRRARTRGLALHLGSLQLSPCKSCKKLIVPHRVCPQCGFYDGQTIIVKKKKEAKDHEETK